MNTMIVTTIPYPERVCIRFPHLILRLVEDLLQVARLLMMGGVCVFIIYDGRVSVLDRCRWYPRVFLLLAGVYIS